MAGFVLALLRPCRPPLLFEEGIGNLFVLSSFTLPWFKLYKKHVVKKKKEADAEEQNIV